MLYPLSDRIFIFQQQRPNPGAALCATLMFELNVVATEGLFADQARSMCVAALQPRARS